MIQSSPQIMRLILAITLLAAFGAASAQTTTTGTGSVSLNGSGTLSYTVVTKGRQLCSPNQRTLLPEFQTWSFGQFVYTDGSGVSHSLSGSAFYVQTAGSGAGCPGTGGSPAVLNGSNFFINVQPGPGNLGAILNVMLFPKYYILSILYDPPGNASSNAFSSGISAAATTSISKTFQSATTNSAGVSIEGQGAGVTWGTSKSTTDAQSFTVSTSQGSGSSSQSGKNPIDHGQDEFFLWLNPMVVVTPTGTGNGTYILTTPPQTAGDPNPGQPQPMDIVRINVADMQNPSQIPIATLGPQTRDNASGIAVPNLPGLANICANPVPACTAVPCGCVASDFAAILKQDPLIGSAQTMAPAQIDPNRFVFVNASMLEGPLCAGCNLNGNNFVENDGTLSSQTETQTNSYSVGYNISSGFSLFGAGFKLEQSKEFTWTNSMSSGTSNGQDHSAQVNLETNSVGCSETVSIYEDTVYHTFAFSFPTAPPAACN